jgi:hypothetical protein
MLIKFWSGNMKRRNKSGDFSVNEWIILQVTFKDCTQSILSIAYVIMSKYKCIYTNYNFECTLTAVFMSLILKTTFIKRHEMEMRLQNYGVTIPIEKSCVICNNNKLNSLQRCDLSQNYIILQRMVQHYCIVTSKFFTITILGASSRKIIFI